MIRFSKTILILIIIFSLLLFPLSSQAAGLVMGDIWFFTKNFIILPITRALLFRLDKKINDFVTGAALRDPSGIAPQLFTGNSLIIGNYRNFGIFSQQRGEDVFRALLARAEVCPYFEKDLKRAFNAEAKNFPIDPKTKKSTLDLLKTQTLTRISDQVDFDVAIGCTLPSDFNFDEFSKDFSKGGWEAWRKIMFEPQNNPYGAFFLSAIEFENQRKFERETSLQTEGTKGFIGRRAPCRGQGPTRRCTILGQTLTPAGFLSEAVSKKIDTSTAGLIQSEDIFVVLASIIGSVTTSFTNKIFDLTGVSEARFFTEEFQREAELGAEKEKTGIEKICRDRCGAQKEQCFKNVDLHFSSCIDSSHGDPNLEEQCVSEKRLSIQDCAGRESACIQQCQQGSP